MKFEKFFKGVGTHGLVIERTNGDKWLVCDGVGMLIPKGVRNILSVADPGDNAKDLLDNILKAKGDMVELVRATIPADGKPADVIRIFGDGLDVEIGIVNAYFGLLEKRDIRLSCVEVDDEKYLSILDFEDNTIGFIQGVKNI